MSIAIAKVDQALRKYRKYQPGYTGWYFYDIDDIDDTGENTDNERVCASICNGAGATQYFYSDSDEIQCHSADIFSKLKYVCSTLGWSFA